MNGRVPRKSVVSVAQAYAITLGDDLGLTLPPADRGLQPRAAPAQPCRVTSRHVDAHPPAAREYPLAISAGGGNGVHWRKPNGGDEPPRATLELTDMHGVTHRLTQDAFEEG